MTVKQYVSFLPPFVMRVIFASIGRVDVAADMFNLFLHEASQLLDRTKTNSRIARGIEYCRICLSPTISPCSQTLLRPEKPKESRHPTRWVPVSASDNQAPTGKAHLWAVSKCSNNDRDKFKLDAEEASIARRWIVFDGQVVLRAFLLSECPCCWVDGTTMDKLGVACRYVQ
jgi:hypothetical protein